MSKDNSQEIALSVSELVASIKQQLEHDFSELFLEGEISNLTQSSTGHWYFNISDQDASISCALFRNQTQALNDVRKIKDGEKIKIIGHISVYAKRTAIQVIVKKIISADTQGDLKKKFELLKAKLAQEGFFDISKKRKLPEYITRVAVVTAENAAALRDFVTVMKRRSLEYSITIFPSVVQGEQAPASLIAALDRVEKVGKFDVVVITRGGGSQEDLWCFNDERLVRRVADMKIPTISAIGHEVDYTLCDFVADLRCETPTAAAEILSSKQLKMQQLFQAAQKQLQAFGLRKKQYVQYLIESLKPGSQIKYLQNLLLMKRQNLNRYAPKTAQFEKRIYKSQVTLEQAVERVSHLAGMILKQKNNSMERLTAQLRALDPYQVLGRGYAMLQDDKGRVVTNMQGFEKLTKGSLVTAKFSDGSGELIKK